MCVCVCEIIAMCCCMSEQSTDVVTSVTWHLTRLEKSKNQNKQNAPAFPTISNILTTSVEMSQNAALDMTVKK